MRKDPEMNNRNRYSRNQRYGGDYDNNSQEEQFADSERQFDNDYGRSQNYGSGQMGDAGYADAGYDYDRNDRFERSEQQNFGSQRGGGFNQRSRPQSRQQSDYRGQQYGYASDFRDDQYGNVSGGYQNRSSGRHSDFRADDYGSETYGQGGFGAYSGQSFNNAGYAEDGYGRMNRNRNRNERGFFDKAGDEIASWFGDEDAERRRRRDHRGRGPANYERSNERLLEDACERLTHDSRVDASNINVTADNNEITLDGTVDSRMAKRRAEDCVHDISGVNHVQNNLRIDDTMNDYGSNESTMSQTRTTETT